MFEFKALHPNTYNFKYPLLELKDISRFGASFMPDVSVLDPNIILPQMRMGSRPSLRSGIFQDTTQYITNPGLPGWRLAVGAGNPDDRATPVRLEYLNRDSGKYTVVGRFNDVNQFADPKFNASSLGLSTNEIDQFKSVFVNQGLQGVVSLYDKIHKSGGQDLIGFLDPDVRLVATYGMVGAHDSVAPASAKPYGAPTLADTNPEKFRASMLEQMRHGGITPPDVYMPFPDTHIADPATSFGGPSSVIGESVMGSQIGRLNKDLTESFSAQPACDSLAVTNSPQDMNFRTFTALHETTHHIALNTKVGGVNLNDDVANAANQIHNDADKAQLLALLQDHPANSHASYQEIALLEPVSFIMLARHDEKAARLLTYASTKAQIPERIADASAALYMLSNYGDKAGTRAFLQDVRDFRLAHYTDTVHDTASSIDAAISAYDNAMANPASRDKLQGMSIIDTTKWAASVVKGQPEFNRSMDVRTQDFMEHVDNNDRLAVSSLRMSPDAMQDPIVRMDQRQIDNIVQARGRACHVAPMRMSP